MEIQNIKLEDLKPYEKNPRKNDEAVQYVAESIKQFGFKVPIIIDKNNTIIAGHTRLKAATQLGLKEVPCIVADDLTPAQIKAFRLADNKVSEKSEWDFELLDEELKDIIDIDMEDLGFLDMTIDKDIEVDEMKDYKDKLNSKNLSERFIAPPFSILDSRQGYWQDRKRQWKDFGIHSEVGRNDKLIGGFFTFNGMAGTSIFDPVLCEIAYKWFNIENGIIFDPFAGGSVRGIVAEKLGYKYIGIDLRQEQIEANILNAKELELNPTWYCDDSLNCDNYLKDKSVDFIFSCPPYADLEKYSDDPRDLSNMNYDDFKNVYFEIIKKTCNKLKDNRFACFVVGDVRDKDGFYYNFVDDTKKAFIDAGLKFYNEIVLVNAVGSASLRAGKQFSSGRKVVKTHQNVLVFYKGDPKEIKNNYQNIEVEDIIKTQILESELVEDAND